MKRFVSVLIVALSMTAMLAASAVPALAIPLNGDFGLADCSYYHGTVTVVDGEFVCKQSDPVGYSVYYY